MISNRLTILSLVVGMFLWSPMALRAVEPSQPQAALQGCGPQSQQESGANYVICMPAGDWNQKLIIYAHGYVAPNAPLMDLTTDAAVIGLAGTLTLQGYAFAATSYSQNGLAVQEGIEDIVDLTAIFEEQEGTPDKTYLLGFSQGGLISALALERQPELFDGGWALCGPYGDFREQSDYFAHGRVLFDYFFPDIMEGSPEGIPESLMENWETYYAENIEPVLADSANAQLVDQLLATAGIAFNADDESSKAASIENVLWYNVFATNNGIEQLGGQPFDNMETVYSGSDDDTKLNEEVARFTADAAALTELEQYQTSGALSLPLVTMHTTLDPVVPYAQMEGYQEKIDQAEANAYHQHVDSSGYGHCQFSQLEIFQSLTTLETLVAATSAAPTETVNPDTSTSLEIAPEPEISIDTRSEDFNIFLPVVIKAN